jgi:hypothetical protein
MYRSGIWDGSAMMYCVITDCKRQWLVLYLPNGQVELGEHKSNV